MPRAIEELIRRGYWDKADDGTGGSAGGGSSDGGDDGDGASDGGDTNGNTDDDPGDGDDDPSSGNGPSEKEAELIKEVMKKKDAIKDLKKQVSDLTSSLSKWDGFDADDVKQLLQEKKSAETKKLEAKGEWDKLKSQMNDAHAAEIASLKAQIEEMKNGLGTKDATIEKLTIGHSFDGSKFISEELTLTPRKARVIYGSHFDIEDGQVVGYDKPRGESGRTQLVDGKGDPLGFEAALQKIVDADPDRDNLIRSKMKPGANSKSAGDKAPKGEAVKLKGLDRINQALNEQTKGK